MGYNLNRFKSKIYNEVVCAICFGVLHTPYEIVECGHLFCESCLRHWLSDSSSSSSSSSSSMSDHEHETGTCPIDRNEVMLPDDIRPAPEFITDFIGRLVISCDFAPQGCIVKVPLAELARHRAQCPLNPLKPIACSRGCGVHLPPSQMLRHRCELDLCQDAIIWNDIIENAKRVTKRRSHDRYLKRRHSFLGDTTKKLVTVFTKWLADPRFQLESNENNVNEQVDHHKVPQAVTA